MRLTLSALVVAAGLAGFGTSAQAAPVPAGNLAGIATESLLVQPVQMTRRERMVRHRMMRHRMHHRRAMRHRMMHRRMHHRRHHM